MTSRRYRRILTPPKGSFFVYGVRGVGKTTWARQTFPEAHNAQAEFLRAGVLFGRLHRLARPRWTSSCGAIASTSRSKSKRNRVFRHQSSRACAPSTICRSSRAGYWCISVLVNSERRMASTFGRLIGSARRSPPVHCGRRAGSPQSAADRSLFENTRRRGLLRTQRGGWGPVCPECPWP